MDFEEIQRARVLLRPHLPVSYGSLWIKCSWFQTSRCSAPSPACFLKSTSWPNPPAPPLLRSFSPPAHPSPENPSFFSLPAPTSRPKSSATLFQPRGRLPQFTQLSGRDGGLSCEFLMYTSNFLFILFRFQCV